MMEPLVPPDVDIRGFSGFMLDVDRLLASELVALGTPEECWCAVMLWCRAWQQVPAGSLPNDERILAAFSKAGPRWKKVRDMALRGFVLCSDGRLYHRVLAEQVTAAWSKRKAYRADQERLKRWREARRAKGSEASDDTPTETPVETHFNGISEMAPELPPEMVSESDRQGQGQGQGQKKERKKDPSSLRSDAPIDESQASEIEPPASPSPPLDARTELFCAGLAIVGRLTGKPPNAARKVLGTLVKTANDDCAMLLDVLRSAETMRPADPVAWLVKATKSRASTTEMSGQAPRSPPVASAPVANPPLAEGGSPYADHDPWGMFAWARRQPDFRMAADERGQVVPTINGFCVEAILTPIALAAGIDDTERPRLDALGGWLRDDLDVNREWVLDAIRRTARRLDGPVRSLAAFDATVRGAARRIGASRSAEPAEQELWA